VFFDDAQARSWDRDVYRRADMPTKPTRLAMWAMAAGAP
jgi:hypothetical protein